MWVGWVTVNSGLGRCLLPHSDLPYVGEDGDGVVAGGAADAFLATGCLAVSLVQPERVLSGYWALWQQPEPPSWLSQLNLAIDSSSSKVICAYEQTFFSFRLQNRVMPSILSISTPEQERFRMWHSLFRNVSRISFFQTEQFRWHSFLPGRYMLKCSRRFGANLRTTGLRCYEPLAPTVLNGVP